MLERSDQNPATPLSEARTIVGRHVLADLSGIPADDLRNESLLNAALKEALLAAGFQLIDQRSYKFPGHESGVTGVALLSDFFHMHIEETDSPQALRDAGSQVTHVHVADNTRMEPGTGDIDFPATIAALRDIGFDGYLAYECGISGDSDDAKATNLANSLNWLRGLL